VPLTFAVAFFGIAACAVDPTAPANPRSTPDSPAPTPSSPTGSKANRKTAHREQSSVVTPIRVIVGNRTLTAQLYDNATAHDLAAQLPLTLTLDDLNGLEKTGPLPKALITDGAPRGSDPEVNEIGYYAPGRDLVFYYGDVGYFNGIVRIGHFDSDIDLLRDQQDGFSVTVERA
jgi:hypothetical protein